MESGLSSGQLSVHQMGETSDRSFCDLSKQKMPGVLLSSDGPSGVCLGFSQHSLGESLRLCFSPKGHSNSGPQKIEERRRRNDSHKSSLASKTMVFHDSGNANRSSSISPQNSSSTNSEGRMSATTRLSPPNRLEAVRSKHQARGISESAANTIMASRRSSTNELYQCKWSMFCSWCSSKQIDPLCATLAQIIDFLQFKFDSGLAASTLRGYAAAISPAVGLFEGFTLTSHPLVTDFLEGALNLRPPIHKVVPRWNLPLVICAFMEKCFEPPEKCSLMLWTWKTVLLLAVTSLARCSELHAFDHRPEYTVFRDDSVSLTVNKFFLPKNFSHGHKLKNVKLKVFKGNPKDTSQSKWSLVCPVRALRIYLQKTKDIRKDNQLFVSYAKRSLGQKVTKTTISRWISKCIAYCYELMGKPPPKESSGHSTRGMGASFAELGGVPLSDICQAANWSSNYVFSKYYRLDLASTSKSVSDVVLSQALS